MLNGIKIAAQGMEALAKTQEIIANNIANVNTVGYKKDLPVYRSFGETLQDSQDRLASASPAGVIDDVAADKTQGNIAQTENPFDFAILDKGFFEVETPDGTRYTRAGNFKLNDKRELVTQQGFPVQGASGTVVVPEGKTVNFSKDGTLYVDGTSVNRIKVVRFTDETKMAKDGSNLFRVADGESLSDTGELLTGSLEMSTANPLEEMVAMISNLRNFEALQKVVKSEDSILDKAANSVGRL